jgi:hypothetical protein
LDATERLYVVDSAYALNRLRALAPLEVYQTSLTIAMGCGPAHHGLMFEALVHQLFRLPETCITFHVQLRDKRGLPTGQYERIKLDMKIHTDCSGANEEEAMNRLGNLDIGTDSATYWSPDFPRFSVIDAVLFAAAIRTVFYLQVTVAKEHDLNCNKLKAIHKAAKNALKSQTEGWVFKYVAITQFQDQTEKLVLKDGNRIVSLTKLLGEVTISKGYVTHVMRHHDV